MHRYKTLILLVFAVVLLAACKKGPRPPRPNINLPISTSKPAKGDHAIYGLACMGCTDSVVVLLPNSGGDLCATIYWRLPDSIRCLAI